MDVSALIEADGRPGQAKAASQCGRSRQIEEIASKVGPLALSAVRNKWMVANYLVAIGSATAGWLYFIVWIALLLI
jgi:hypothetical protein